MAVDIDLLVNNLEDNIVEAESLALEAVRSAHVPLVSPRYSRLQLESGIRGCNQLNGVKERVSCLLVLTDQVVSSIVSQSLAFYANAVNEKSLVKMISSTGKAWDTVFGLICRGDNREVSLEYIFDIRQFLMTQQSLLSRHQSSVFLNTFTSSINKHGFIRPIFIK